MLPIVLDEAVIDELFRDVKSVEGYQLTIDLAKQLVIRPNGETVSFEVDEFRKHCLLNGLDDIGLTEQKASKIDNFENDRVAQQPWLSVTAAE